MRFYLGTHMPSWLWGDQVNERLFVSARRLRERKKLKPATTDWAMDSGGFTELAMHGGWTIPAHQYAAYVRRVSDEVGRLEWAAPQDWMCEPVMLERTKLTVENHQELTIDNYLELKRIWPEGPFIPVLQGWGLDDYMAHVDAYERRGVDLWREPLVGLGTVCRRQNTGPAQHIVMRLKGISLHGFGIKTEGIQQYGEMLSSSDSLAWSFAGRKRPDPNCPHKTCANCLHWALEWRAQMFSPTRPTLYGGEDQ